MFQKCDKNNNGTLTYNELRKCFLKYDGELASKYLRAVWQCYDGILYGEYDDKMTEEEFMYFTRHRSELW